MKALASFLVSIHDVWRCHHYCTHTQSLFVIGFLGTIRSSTSSSWLVKTGNEWAPPHTHTHNLSARLMNPVRSVSVAHLLKTCSRFLPLCVGGVFGRSRTDSKLSSLSCCDGSPQRSWIYSALRWVKQAFKFCLFQVVKLIPNWHMKPHLRVLFTFWLRNVWLLTILIPGNFRILQPRQRDGKKLMQGDICTFAAHVTLTTNTLRETNLLVRRHLCMLVHCI